MLMKSRGATLSPGVEDLVDLSSLLERVELLRLEANRKLDPARRASLGQFMTPAPVAHLVASMAQSHTPHVRLLDAGAGVGSLTAAWVANACAQQDRPRAIHVVAFEIEPLLVPYLDAGLDLCRQACEQVHVKFTSEIRSVDFIRTGVEGLRSDLFSSGPPALFDTVIMNPPYRKLGASSRERALLESLGVGSTNLYTAFLSVAVRLLALGGELVAITPRRFCNGTYFRGFRNDFLSRVALQHIHVFESRDRAFSGDEVLQENVIFRAVRSAKPPAKLLISTSGGADSHDIQERAVPYDQVVRPGDSDQFIRLTTDGVADEVASHLGALTHSLEDLGIQVSTGRVVDFRAQESLRKDPGTDTVPLVYPGHLHQGFVRWPRPGFKKSNALVKAQETEALLIPEGVYVLVKRFSSKEETRRVVAAIYDPARMPGGQVGLENHLNYFHEDGHGLDMVLAKGLAAFLNSTMLDMYFRQLSGHTQVNAGDLRNMKYPSREQLLALGRRIGDVFPAQEELDHLAGETLFPGSTANAMNPLRITTRIEEAKSILADLGIPREQLNDRSALTLLALLGLEPDMSWAQAEAPLCGITPIMDFMREPLQRREIPGPLRGSGVGEGSSERQWAGPVLEPARVTSAQCLGGIRDSRSAPGSPGSSRPAGWSSRTPRPLLACSYTPRPQPSSPLPQLSGTGSTWGSSTPGPQPGTPTASRSRRCRPEHPGSATSSIPSPGGSASSSG
jgi:adenine-specific DNA-methyltransferase